MTRDHRIVLSLGEITALRWTCLYCKSEISFPIGQMIRLPKQCPACFAQQVSETDEAYLTREAFNRAIAAIQEVHQILSRSKLPGAALELEFSEPSSDMAAMIEAIKRTDAEMKRLSDFELAGLSKPKPE